MPSSPPRILLVDDEELMVATLGRWLARTGARVATATSTAAGLQALADDHDLVITDLNLGDGLGTELVAALDAAGHRARVLFLTSSPARLAHLAVGPGRRVAAVVEKGGGTAALRDAIAAALAEASPVERAGRDAAAPVVAARR